MLSIKHNLICNYSGSKASATFCRASFEIRVEDSGFVENTALDTTETQRCICTRGLTSAF
jgi:hypothetical protein